MASVFGGFSGFQNIAQWGVWLGYFVLFVLCAGIITAVVVFIAVKAKEKTIIEINGDNKRMKTMAGRERKNSAGRMQLWIGKYKKFLPKLQERDVYIQGKKDVVLLLKDNNGLHHTLRIPT